MAAIIGALLLAAGFLFLALTYFFFRRPDPHPVTQNDNFGNYVALVITVILAFGVAVLAEDVVLARPWELAAATGIVAASLVILAAAVARTRRLAAAASFTPFVPPAAAARPPRKRSPSRPLRPQKGRRKAA